MSPTNGWAGPPVVGAKGKTADVAASFDSCPGHAGWSAAVVAPRGPNGQQTGALFAGCWRSDPAPLLKVCLLTKSGALSSRCESAAMNGEFVGSGH